MQPIIVHPGEGHEVTAFGDTIVFKLVGGQTGNDLTLGLVITPPGGGPPPHVHHHDHEIFIMDSGDIEVNVGGEWKKSPPGSVVFLPKGVPHTFRNAGDTPSRHWAIVTPSGFETFFERCAGIFAEGGPPDIEKVMAACADHGLEILGPPPGRHA